MRAVKEIIAGKFFVCILVIMFGLMANTELCAQDQVQDAVYLKNGSIIRGEITEVIPSKEVRIQTNDGSLFVYDINEVESVQMKEADTAITQQEESLSEEKPIDERNKWTGNVNFFAGGKSLSDADKWEPLSNEHVNLGVLVDFKPPNWPVSISIDVLYHLLNDKFETIYYSGREWELHYKGKTTEIHLGVRKIWDNHSIIRPFIGGGLALIKAELEVSSPLEVARFNEDDMGVGMWLEGGTYFTIAKHLNLGLSCRWSKADISMTNPIGDEVSGDAGGWHYGAIVGYHW